MDKSWSCLGSQVFISPSVLFLQSSFSDVNDIAPFKVKIPNLVDGMFKLDFLGFVAHIDINIRKVHFASVYQPFSQYCVIFFGVNKTMREELYLPKPSTVKGSPTNPNTSLITDRSLLFCLSLRPILAYSRRWPDY
jgi:hypothetical protein